MEQRRQNSSRFINAKLSESRAKVQSPNIRVGRLKKEHCIRGPKIPPFYWDLYT
jgi:hypothetical protein